MDVARSLYDMGFALKRRGRFEEAVAPFRESLAIRRKLLGDTSEDTLFSLYNVASALHELKNLTEAEALYRENLELARKAWPKGLHLSYPLAGLAVLLNQMDRAAEAEPLLRECLAIQTGELPEGHWHITSTRALLGRTLFLQGRLSEAERVLAEACVALKQNSAVPPHRKKLAYQYLIDIYDALKQTEKAAEYRALLLSAADP